MTVSPQNPFVMQESHQPSFQLQNQRRQMLRKKYTLIWGILLDWAPGFYRALGLIQHFMYWEQISPGPQLWLHVLNSSGWVQLNTLNSVHKQQWEPFQNAYHHSLSEWKTNIQTIHLNRVGNEDVHWFYFPHLTAENRQESTFHTFFFCSIRKTFWPFRWYLLDFMLSICGPCQRQKNLEFRPSQQKGDIIFNSAISSAFYIPQFGNVMLKLNINLYKIFTCTIMTKK